MGWAKGAEIGAGLGSWLGPLGEAVGAAVDGLLFRNIVKFGLHVHSFKNTRGVKSHLQTTCS